MKTLIAVYGHPESHGPQIYAIEMIATHSESVDVFFRNVDRNSWKFPKNVSLVADGKYENQQDVYLKSYLKKFYYLLRFSWRMFRLVQKQKYDLIVLFDPLAFLSLKTIFAFISKKSIFWYHNYDAIDLANTGKYTLAWFAHKAPYRLFKSIDYFTLPMEERVPLFPVSLLKNKYFIIPNYSLKEIHRGMPGESPKEEIILTYVGSIGAGHGLEEIIEMLSEKIEGRGLRLLLKGYIQEEYRQFLENRAASLGVAEKLSIIPKGPWEEVPKLIRNCHIGIAIYLGKDQMNTTLGRGGSGKVFQYIAEGLPVLMNTEFHRNFTDCNWAIPTSLTKDDLRQNIGHIVLNYGYVSTSASQDFLNKFNCNIYYNRFFEIMSRNEKIKT